MGDRDRIPDLMTTPAGGAHSSNKGGARFWTSERHGSDTRPDRQPWLIAPAVAVMNRLTYPRKFALISLLFVMPLAVVMGLLISEMNTRIGFARKEIQGIRYLRPLRQLFEHALQSRALARSYSNGKVSLRPELIKRQADISEDLATLQAIELELGYSLRTTSKHEALRENCAVPQGEAVQTGSR